MSGPLGITVPLFLSASSIPLADGPLHLVPLQIAITLGGLVGMGLRGFIGGGGDDDEGPSELSGADDFLDAGEFGGGQPDGGADGDGFDRDHDPLEELEPRVDDLEHELEELASTVSAVRRENQSIRESVDGIESNVRKLLEIYEVVTRGANPFVDEAEEASHTGGDTFGLFDTSPGPEASTTGAAESPSVDDLFADAEPVGDELRADEPNGSAGTPDIPDAAASAAATSDRGGGDPRGQGLSFDELESEFDFREEVAEGDDPEPPSTGTEPTRKSEPGAGDESRAAKPYLRTLPGGYGAELLVMEWLTYLVGESSLADAIRAIRYYRTVDWITEDVASQLQHVLAGMTPERQWATPDGGLPTELTVDHHTRSLEFIAELDAIATGGGRTPGSVDRPPSIVFQGGNDRAVQR